MSAEGTPKLSGLTTSTGSFIHRSFSTAVSDGTLNLALTSGFAIDGLDIRNSQGAIEEVDHGACMLPKPIPGVASAL